MAELGLDWDAPPYPESPEAAPAPLQVQVDLGNLFLDDRRMIGLSSIRLAFNPLDFEAFFQRGQAYAHQKNFQEAATDYSMALVLTPANHRIRGELLVRRSQAYRALHDRERANADLQEFAESGLALPQVLLSAAAIQCNDLAWEYATGPVKHAHANKARTLSHMAVKLNPDERAFINTLGVVYYRLGQYCASD